MSNHNFDKKIKDKLHEHKSEYDSRAWEKFKPLLPVPWYTTLFQNYGAWLIGGLASTALIFSLIYQNQKNNLLNEEISTLRQELNAISKTDTIFINKTLRDTVYLTKVIEKYKYKEAPANQSFGQKEVERYLAQNPELIKAYANKFAQLDDLPDKEKTSSKSAMAIESENEDKLLQKNIAVNELDDVKKSTDNSVVEKADAQTIEKEEVNVADQKLKDSLQTEHLEETFAKSTPEKQKKKINLPRMRLGIGSDYLGLRTLTNGMNAEVFLTDKLSFNTGIMFSGIVETVHPLPRDFNKQTGKQFQEEFKKYNPRIPDQIKDINIRTSFIRLPLHLNYYINTWSRFNFIISAGTNLDLSVYQDINFSSGQLNNQIKSRFEARPNPKVFNNFNYGMGVQYQYGHIVGQLLPYFDFRFRNPDYFTPKNNFGLSAALKYEF